MIYFLGNCQTGFLGQAFAERGGRAEVRCLASPFTHVMSKGRVPEVLEEMLGRLNLGDYLHARTLKNQFLMLGPDDEPPELAVFNLFHETEPLFSHAEERWAFYIDPRALEASPGFGRFIRRQFEAVRLDPLGYPGRFAAMVGRFRDEHPGVPILIVTRLSHFPAFGDSLYSYLACWDAIWRDAGDALREWAATVPDCHVLDMDRVFAGIWARGEKRIEAHCPFVRVRVENGRLAGLTRDVEHIGSMWPRLAEKVEEFLRLGRVVYEPEEVVPAEWLSARYVPERLGRSEMEAMLRSGANYLAARAVGAFFADLGQDCTDLLVRCRVEMPVCHNTLHMIRAYARLKPDPALLDWTAAHRVRAEMFTDNGRAFQAEYLSRLDGLERLAMGLEE